MNAWKLIAVNILSNTVGMYVFIYILNKFHFHHTDIPVVSLELGTNSINSTFREGIDVFFECNIKSNPWVYKVSWRHNVSMHSGAHIAFWNNYLWLFKNCFLSMIYMVVCVCDKKIIIAYVLRCCCWWWWIFHFLCLQRWQFNLYNLYVCIIIAYDMP